MPSWMGQNSSLGGREKGRFYVTDAYHYQYQKKKFLKKKKKKSIEKKNNVLMLHSKEKQCAGLLDLFIYFYKYRKI